MSNIASGAATGAATGAFLGPWGAIAGGLIGGITSVFAGQSEADAINERIKRAQSLAAESIVDSGEISSRLNSIDRMFNQRLTSVLNTTAIRSRGFANSGTVGAAVAGGVEGDRLAAKSQTLSMAHDSNRQVQNTISQMELGTASANPISDFVTGATSGIALGNEIGKYMGNINETTDLTGGGDQPASGQGGPQPMSNLPKSNPFVTNAGDIPSMVPSEVKPTYDIQNIISSIVPPSGGSSGSNSPSVNKPSSTPTASPLGSGQDPASYNNILPFWGQNTGSPQWDYWTAPADKTAVKRRGL